MKTESISLKNSTKLFRWFEAKYSKIWSEIVETISFRAIRSNTKVFGSSWMKRRYLISFKSAPTYAIRYICFRRSSFKELRMKSIPFLFASHCRLSLFALLSRIDLKSKSMLFWIIIKWQKYDDDDLRPPITA